MTFFIRSIFIRTDWVTRLTQTFVCTMEGTSRAKVRFDTLSLRSLRRMPFSVCACACVVFPVFLDKGPLAIAKAIKSSPALSSLNLADNNLGKSCGLQIIISTMSF